MENNYNNNGSYNNQNDQNGQNQNQSNKREAHNLYIQFKVKLKIDNR